MNQQKKFISSSEMANELGVSKSYSYKVIRKLNEELKAKGYFVVTGKVSRAYFEEKFYGISEVI